MKDIRFADLVSKYENGPEEFKATSYWKSYESRVFKAIDSLDTDNLRSGEYPVLRTFGFNEIVFPERGWKLFAKKAALKLFKRLFGSPTHYSLSIRDTREMAFRFAEVYGELTGTPSIDGISTSSFGNPADLFKVRGKNYSIVFINYYLRLCFANSLIKFSGREIFVELGSGSGHQAEIIKKVYPNSTILCFDLPGQIYLAEKYLRGVLGQEVIVPLAEGVEWVDLANVQEGKIHFFGNWQFPLLSNFKFDVFWNAASFGEMEPNVVRNYLSYVVQNQNASFIYLLQAKKGKETSGGTHVVKPIQLADYNLFLENKYHPVKIQDYFLCIKPLSASGGYFEGVWRKDV